MITRLASRVTSAAAGAVLAAGMLAVPTLAAADPLPATAATEGCAVTGGTLKWGLKESFRSYISGSIANGSWDLTDGVTYETPTFIWQTPTGSIDPLTGTGKVSFTGTVHFTGHGGVLDLTLANPSIEFEGDGKAALLLDAKSTNMEGEVSIDAKQEWVGDVEVTDEISPSNGKVSLKNMKTTLTNSGAGAFAGFYDSGVELDPINLEIELADCDVQAAPGGSQASAGTKTPKASPEGETVATAPETTVPEATVPWLPIGVGGMALLVIGFTCGLLLGGRKAKRAAVAPEAATDAPSSAEPSA